LFRISLFPDYRKFSEQVNAKAGSSVRRLITEYGVSQRHSGEWLASFLSDPQQMWTSDHPETEELKKRIRKSRSPRTLCKKNPMSGEELQDLLDYLSTL